MKKAFKMKRIAIDTGNQAFVAIIVKQGNEVGPGASKVHVIYDPTTHAKIRAIRDACRNLKSKNLTECERYSTSRPCRMCKTAGYWALLVAASQGDAVQIKILAATGVQIDERDTHGRTPLHVAAVGAHHAAMRALSRARGYGTMMELPRLAGAR